MLYYATPENGSAVHLIHPPLLASSPKINYAGSVVYSALTN